MGESVQVLVEEVDSEVLGRAGHQAPEVDGNVRLISRDRPAPGDMVDAIVTDTDGADLVATAILESVPPIGLELTTP
jgi:hypothetical protein